MVYTLLSVPASGLGDRPRKEGRHGGGVYSFFPGSHADTPRVFNEAAESCVSRANDGEHPGDPNHQDFSKSTAI